MMNSRSRGGKPGGDWDPMRSEYESSVYEAQTAEDESGSGGLDHSRLYITSIPQALNEEGFEQVFAKFGTLQEAFLNPDPTKRFGLIKYETNAEAKLAMMKLNQTEPLNLSIRIANKSSSNKRNNQDRHRNQGERRSYRERDYGNELNDNISNSSRGKYGRSETVLGDESYMDDLDEMNDVDPDVEIQVAKIRQLLYSKARRVPEKKTMPSVVGGRCLMPDGKIVVRNDGRAYEKNEKLLRDVESSFSGSGDSSKIPALQHVTSHTCVNCGAPADTYCGKCRVTPYCSVSCQKRDWDRRHSACCHNVARSAMVMEEVVVQDDQVDIPAMPALRRPRSPRRNDEEKPSGKFMPPGHTPALESKPSYNNQDRGGRYNNRDNQENKGGYNRDNQDNRAGRNNNRDNQEKRDGYKRDNQENRGGYNRDNQEKRGAYNRNQNQQGGNQNQRNRRPYPKQEVETNEDEDWGAGKKEASTPKTAKLVEEPPKPSVVSTPPSKGPGPSSAVTPMPRAKPAPVSVPVVEEKPLVPAKCVIDLLPSESTVLLSVENAGTDCRVDDGFVCVTLHEDYQDSYMLLCEEYLLKCEEDATELKPVPGESLSIFNVEDESWYRARCLNPTTVALLDAGKTMKMTADSKCRKLMEKYAALPEFCCLLRAKSVKVGDNVKAIINSKKGDKCTVSLLDVNTDSVLGEGEMTRWLPNVEYPPPPAPAPSPASAAKAAPVIPEVARPNLENKSEVVVVEAGDARAIFVRPANITSLKEADMIEQDVAQYGITATPLKEPPTMGQTVVAKFTDGNHYRALCKRTNVKLNKYLLEYIEYGNSEVTTLEKLYPCPPHLDLAARPALTAKASLHNVTEVLTAPAKEYLDNIKNQTLLVTLTLPNNEKSAPSGSDVVLTLSKNGENVSNKVKEMCTPDWKKIEEKGGDVLDTQIIMISDVKYPKLAASGGEMQIMDSSLLLAGTLSVCPATAAELCAEVLGPLTLRMTEYCNSEIGSKPYLPRVEEVCLARFPPFEQWFRAVLCEVAGGAGGQVASVLYLDYGNMETVAVADLRKCLPEFITQPVLAVNAEIRDFPKEPTAAQLQKAREYLEVAEDGSGGRVTAAKCELVEAGTYVISVPGLITAISTV